jgi:hypothetical protein
MHELENKLLAHVLSQIKRDAESLAQLVPALPWQQRAETAARRFLSRLFAVAPGLIREVELTLNSPQIIRITWEQIKAALQAVPVTEATKQQVAVMDHELALEAKLLTVVTGEIVSHLMADFLCREVAGLQQNNRSTYPDLYFDEFDYSQLPPRRRGSALGPARKGLLPSSVPDGVEIKSQRGKRIRVDCHHNHQGLHLVLTFDQAGDRWQVFDLYVAYLTQADYRRATRNTTATTEKFSFSQAPFISVLTGIAEGAATA